MRLSGSKQQAETVVRIKKAKDKEMSKKKKCPVCGTEIFHGDVCPKCGTRADRHE